MQRRTFIGAACAAICAPAKLLAGCDCGGAVSDIAVTTSGCDLPCCDFELSQDGLWGKFFIRMWEDGTLSAKFGCEHLLRRGPDKSGWYVFEGPTASIRLRLPEPGRMDIDWFKVIQ